MGHPPNPGVQAQVDEEDEDTMFDSRDLMSCMTLRGRNTPWTITDRYMSHSNLNMLVARIRWKMKKKKLQKTKKILYWYGRYWCQTLFSQYIIV